MNINYENLLKVTFEFEAKAKLNEVEFYGLESILEKLIKDYEKENFGEATTDISKYTIFRDNKVQILDGYNDVYVMGEYALHSVCMTHDGIVLVEAYPVNEDYEPNFDEDSFYLRVN